ncbi:hypothetical protein [Geodermatophilus sp. SYSU D00766]
MAQPDPREDADGIDVEVRVPWPLPSPTVAAFVSARFAEVRRDLTDVDAVVAGATCLVRGQTSAGPLPVPLPGAVTQEES